MMDTSVQRNNRMEKLHPSRLSSFGLSTRLPRLSLAGPRTTNRGKGGKFRTELFGATRPGDCKQRSSLVCTVSYRVLRTPCPSQTWAKLGKPQWPTPHRPSSGELEIFSPIPWCISTCGVARELGPIIERGKAWFVWLASCIMSAGRLRARLHQALGPRPGDDVDPIGSCMVVRRGKW